MGRGRGKKDFSWGDVREAPRAEVPDERRLLIRRKVAFGVILVALLSLPFNVVAIGNVLAGSDEPQQQQAADGSEFSQSRAAAWSKVSQWLASTPEPLPGGRVVSIDETKKLKYPSPPVDEDGKTPDVKKPGYETEVVNFTLVDDSGRLYRAGVNVAVDPRGSATAMGEPSLEAVAPAANDSWNDGGLWPGREEMEVPAAAERAVESWADAYVSGDATTLRMQVQDPSNDSYYSPLQGVKSVETSVDQATDLGDDTIAVRVTLKPTWREDPEKDEEPKTKAEAEAEKKAKQEEERQERPGIELDVRVEAAGTAAPRVTAWGHPGAGPNLEKYENSIDSSGRPARPDENESPDDADAPDSSESPDPTEDPETESPSGTDSPSPKSTSSPKSSSSSKSSSPSKKPSSRTRSN